MKPICLNVYTDQITKTKTKSNNKNKTKKKETNKNADLFFLLFFFFLFSPKKVKEFILNHCFSRFGYTGLGSFLCSLTNRLQPAQIITRTEVSRSETCPHIRLYFQ